MIRAVIDVNVLVSSIIGLLGFSRQVALAWAAGRFRGIASEGIYTKLEEKLALPRIARRYNVNTPEDIRWIQGLLRSDAELVIVPLSERLSVTGDPEDDYVLATGRLAQADYLVTGDRRLLELGQFEGMKIVTPRQFVEILTTVETTSSES
jgi:putative PIN family toxin of toxin-antitoxin system